MLEKIIVFAVIAVALAYVVSRFVRKAGGKQGCGCCAGRDTCPSASDHRECTPK